jgi:MarR family transcriptional regulator, organic hydroperoxide resistance regulator
MQNKDDTPLGHLVPQVCRLHHTRSQTLFNSIGLHRGQPFLLAVLWAEEGLAHSELAARMHVTPATITKMLQRMEDSGFVHREPDPDDQRVSRVYLTDYGRVVRQRVADMWQTLENESFAGLTPDEQETFRQLLLRMRDNLRRANGETVD